MLLTEDRVMELVTLATKYAKSRSLDVNCYVDAMLDPNTIGETDAGQIVEKLIKYHKDWLSK